MPIVAFYAFGVFFFSIFTLVMPDVPHIYPEHCHLAMITTFSRHCVNCECQTNSKFSAHRRQCELPAFHFGHECRLECAAIKFNQRDNYSRKRNRFSLYISSANKIIKWAIKAGKFRTFFLPNKHRQRRAIPNI